MEFRAQKLILLPPMLVAAGVFLAGINWGFRKFPARFPGFYQGLKASLRPISTTSERPEKPC